MYVYGSAGFYPFDLKLCFDLETVTRILLVFAVNSFIVLKLLIST